MRKCRGFRDWPRATWRNTKRTTSSVARFADGAAPRVLAALERKLALSTLLGLIAIGVVLFVLWDWLTASSQGHESGSTTARNIGFLIAAILALPLAVWRGRVADQQRAISQETLLNERYQKGAEMLGNSILSVRLAGIYALERLAEDFPKRYHVEVIKLLCAFVRFPLEDSALEKQQVVVGQPKVVRQDVQAAMESIGSRSEADVALEEASGYKLDLVGAVLSGLRLPNANLSGGNFENATLAGSSLRRTNLSGANLNRADLSSPSQQKGSGPITIFPVFGWNTDFTSANLSKANLNRAELRGVSLGGADLSGARMFGAQLQRSNLTDSVLSGAVLSGADLTGADLSGAEGDLTQLFGTNLSGADLSGLSLGEGDDPEEWPNNPMVGLTQVQLDAAVAERDNPPMLNGVVQDETTNEPLVWMGKEPRNARAQN